MVASKLGGFDLEGTIVDWLISRLSVGTPCASAQLTYRLGYRAAPSMVPVVFPDTSYSIPRRMLVLEHESLILLMLQEALTEVRYEVRAVVTTAAALAALDTNYYDVAVLDLRLEHGNSLSVASEMQSRHIPFVFTNTHENVPRAFRDVPVLQEPFDTERLIEVLDRIAA